jgi:hypothetical protein
MLSVDAQGLLLRKACETLSDHLNQFKIFNTRTHDKEFPCGKSSFMSVTHIAAHP